MTPKEKNEKLVEYNERYRYWSEQVSSQFGYTQNLFTTVGLGFIGILVSSRGKYPDVIIDTSLPINWNLIFYFSTLLLVFISVFIGFIALFSRLYDLRLTRHLIHWRKKSFKKLDKSLPDNYIDFDSKWKLRLSTFIKTLLIKIEFINDSDLNDYEQLSIKFEALRKQSKILGQLSWRAHKIQIMILIISVLIYGLTIIK